MKKKFKKLASLLMAVCVFCSAIPSTLAANAEDNPDLSELTTFTFDGDSVTVTENGDANYEVTVYDDTDNDTGIPDKSADSSGNNVYSLPDGSNGQLLVSIKKKGGSYVFQGRGNGSIAVKKGATGNSDLYLNGLELASSFTAALTVKKESTAECIIHTVDSTINTLSDNARNNEESNPENLAAENAVMKFKDGSNVTITGSGTLNIMGNAKNGIKANNLLTVDGNVTLNIDVPNNGINCENSITIKSGDFTIKSGSDGIKASPDEDASVTDDTSLVGNILIEDGTFNITAVGDGIQANNDLIIYNGEFDITCNGGYTTSLASNEDSCKGFKAGSYLSMYDGTYNINSADDAIHSDSYVYMIAGNYSIQSGDDGVHADTSLIIGEKDASDDKLKVYISDSYEGLEGGTVYIYSGYIELASSDDGINAAGGSSNGSGGSIGGDGFRPGGGGGMGPGGSGNLGPGGPAIGIPGVSSSSDYSINIYGGDINVNAGGDGLDSNGSILITDGYVLVFGAASNSVSSDNSALDWETTCVISGGTVLAAGSSQMAMMPSAGSQSCILYTKTVNKGKAINILNGEGKPVYSTMAVKQVNHIIYCSANTTNYTFSITDEMLIKDEPSNPSVNNPSNNNTTKTPAKTTKTIAAARDPKKVAADKKAAQKAMKQAKLTSLKVKSKAKKKINVTWKKVKKAKGYQVQVSAKKNFKKVIFKKNLKKTKLNIKNKKIKSKKTYYVRVRAYATYKNANNKTVKVFSKWNKKLRKVKVK